MRAAPRIFVALILITLSYQLTASHPSRGDKRGEQSQWREPIPISPPAIETEAVDIYASGSDIDIIYMDRADYYWNLRHIRSSDGGVSWSEPSTILSSGIRIKHHTLAGSDEGLYLAYVQGSSSDSRLYFTKNDHGGTTWIEPAIISPEGMNVQHPDLAIIDHRAMVLYMGDQNGTWETYCIKIADQTNRFSQPWMFSLDDGDFSGLPTLYSRDNRVYGVYYDTSGAHDNYKLYLRRSTDYADHWSQPILAVELNKVYQPSFVEKAAISDDGSVVRIVYADYPAGEAKICMVESENQGLSWSAPANMSDQYADIRYQPVMPGITSSPVGVFIAWHDSRGLPHKQSNIYLTELLAQSEQWSPNRWIVYAASFKDALVLVQDGWNPCLVYRDNQDGVARCYFTRSLYSTPTPTPTVPATSPTVTPTTTPTATATAPGCQPPRVIIAGYLNTHITSSTGGYMSLFAAAYDPQQWQALLLEIYFEGEPTGLTMPMIDPVNYFYRLDIDKFPSGIPQGYILIEIMPRGSGCEGDLWPYLPVGK